MQAKVMGTTAHVVVPGDPELEQWAIDRLLGLETLWSRFVPDSELSAVNAAGGTPVEVSWETAGVVQAALDAWTLTDGLFDPSVHDALVALGYDRTFADVPAVGPAVGSAPAPGCAGITVDRGTASAICVPEGVTIDLGGIAKGFAADLVLAELLTAGAGGACVNVGGDLALAGDPPTDDGWIVGIEDPFIPGREILRLALADGAIATTSRIRRRWHRGGDELHHILDPRTGRPADSDVAAVTVIAGRAADAEMLAKVAFLDPESAAELIRASGASAVIINTARRVRCINRVEAYAA